MSKFLKWNEYKTVKNLYSNINENWILANSILRKAVDETGKPKYEMYPDPILKNKDGSPQMSFMHLPEVKFLRSILEPDLLGYIGVFTYLMINENIGRTQLKELADRLRPCVNNNWLKYMKDIHDKEPQFPKEFIEFGQKHIMTPELIKTSGVGRDMTNYELIGDAITRMNAFSGKKKVWGEVQGKLKEIIKAGTPEEQQKVDELFEELAANRLTNVSPTDKHSDQIKTFFSKIAALLSHNPTIKDLIKRLEKFIADINGGYGKIMMELKELEEKTRIDIVYDNVYGPNDSNLVVVAYYDVETCKILGSTSWCITRGDMWKSYESETIEGKSYPLRQFYQIYDFGSTGAKSKIGLFVDLKGNITAQHDFADATINVKNLPYYENIKNILKPKDAKGIIQSLKTEKDIIDICRVYPKIWKEYIAKVDNGEIKPNVYVLVAAMNELDLNTFKKYLYHTNPKEYYSNLPIKNTEHEIYIMLLHKYSNAFLSKNTDAAKKYLAMLDELLQHPDIPVDARGQAALNFSVAAKSTDLLELQLKYFDKFTLNVESLKIVYISAKVNSLLYEKNKNNANEDIEITNKLLDMIANYIKLKKSDSERILNEWNSEAQHEVDTWG